VDELIAWFESESLGLIESTFTPLLKEVAHRIPGMDMGIPLMFASCGAVLHHEMNELTYQFLEKIAALEDDDDKPEE
jgi:hypothetical protein